MMPWQLLIPSSTTCQRLRLAGPIVNVRFFLRGPSCVAMSQVAPPQALEKTVPAPPVVAGRACLWTADSGKPLETPLISHRLPYNCRHTYATIRVMSGLNPAFISQQLGHSVQMLLSTYAHWFDSSSDWSELEKLQIGPKWVPAETSEL